MSSRTGERAVEENSSSTASPCRSCTGITPQPPTPHLCRASTPCANAQGTGGPPALPPRRSTSRPISAACGCGATMTAIYDEILVMMVMRHFVFLARWDRHRAEHRRAAGGEEPPGQGCDDQQERNVEKRRVVPRRCRVDHNHMRV